MSFDNAYEAITEENDSRWAFGTGFAEPLSGVDTTIPSGVDGDELAAYCLMLGDDALVMSHRLQEWITRAPELEEEVALANIGLDLLGQARLLLARAGRAEGAGRGEDELAFFRAEHEFRNVRLAEQTDADFAGVIARLLVFSTWRLALLGRLVTSRDPVLAAIADKGVKELTYHRDYAAQWTLRLGDGTEFSRERMRDGLAAVWPFVGELFTPHPIELRLTGVAVDPSVLWAEFDEVLGKVLPLATLDRPKARGGAGPLGRDGTHTEAMAELLATLQSVPRAHPGATW
ncbi:1,2-phenylacetyl-CoA epoxidase subunit PaaC [Amycolatopsis nigrescens]|uniref:1,2-phenylacetyl-CoA epoxidase subunit PaaC n=1 Tax=Amycolatopsis nigrescens TaxID=381445 RepID=UPI0003749D3D|nr:1,2-phenylacetyl-CoA epoxidase subunit PaaC [Amycolatopsis nigrescens]